MSRLHRLKEATTLSQPTSRSQPILLIAAIILMAANLRPTITGVGPLISAIRAGTGLENSIAGLLTTLPLLAFGVISPLAPRWARKLGIERTLYLGLIVLFIGTLVRSEGSIAWLLIGMFLVGAGAAIANVLLPSLVKRDFPTQIGLMTGLYTTIMNVFAGLASGISIPLSRQMGLGWRGSLASWMIITVIALIVWVPQLRHRHIPDSRPQGGLWRSRIAWYITLFMGLQSFLFYVNVAWLPSLLHDRGLSLATAGWLVSLMQIVSLPATFIVPILAGRRAEQRGYVVAVSAFFLVGYLGLLLTSGALLSIFWVILIGFGAGSSISLALAFFSLRTHHHEVSAQISGMAQSIGYLLASVGPFSIGLLYSASNSWIGPLIILVVVTIVMAFFGLGAARNVYIEAAET